MVDSLKVSIVVPIYQVEEYVTECVNSILSQSYTNIEIILVDDGSLDASGKICDSFALEDERVTVIHKVNGGLSDARNAGIAVSTGKYIAFIDGDDFVAVDFVSTLVNLVEEEKSDIGCISFYKYFEDGTKEVSTKNTKLKRNSYSAEEAIGDIFSLRSTLKVATWNKIYKTSLFKDNGILFPVGEINEDNLTTYKLMYFSNKVTFIDEPLIFYRQRSGSIMRRRITSEDLDRRGAMIAKTRAWLEARTINTQRIIRKYKNTMLVILFIDIMKNSRYKYIGKLFYGYFFAWGRSRDEGK